LAAQKIKTTSEKIGRAGSPRVSIRLASILQAKKLFEESKMLPENPLKSSLQNDGTSSSVLFPEHRPQLLNAISPAEAPPSLTGESPGAPEELAKALNQLQRVFEQAPAALAAFSLGDEPRLLRTNERFRSMFGVRDGQLALVWLRQIVDNEDWRSGAKSFFDLAYRLCVCEQELCILAAEERIWIRATASLLRDDQGNPEFIVVACNNAAQERRERKEIRELRRELMDLSLLERHRLGQELHDDLGQQLTGAAMLAQSLNKSIMGASPERAVEIARRVGEELSQALLTLRRLCRGLLPAGVETCEDLVSALEEMVARAREIWEEVSCEFESEGAPRIADKNVICQLHRIAQEALNNALKHSGATRIVVSLRSAAEKVWLEVRDNGRGVDSEQIDQPSGLGLRIMRHRAESVGATFSLRPLEEGGTSVLIECLSARPSSKTEYPSLEKS
jgi:signal transduction histidine kinase